MTDPGPRLDERGRKRGLGRSADRMIHEFNQPLAIIRSSAENLLIGSQRQWDLPPERTMAKLAVIIAQCDRMAEMIARLRTLGRQDAEPAPSPVAIAAAVADALRQARIETGIEDQVPGAQVLVHPVAFGACLLAVLVHARDAGQAGGRAGRVAVRLVRDNGIAVAITHEAGDAAAADPGLAAARQALANLGCALEVDAAQRGGATIRIRCLEAGA